MRILHVVFSLNNGGIEHFLFDLLKNWTFDDEINILLINDDYNEQLLKKYESIDKLKIYRFNRKKNSNKIKLIFTLVKFFIRNKFDIVHFHQPTGVVIAKIAKLIQKRITTVLHIHDTNLFHKFSKQYLKIIDRKIDNIIAISKSVKNDICMVQKNFLNKTHIVYNGVDFNKFQYKDARIGEEVIIGQVARLEYKKKGQDLLIKACARLIREGYKIKLLFAGSSPDENNLMHLKQITLAENIQSHVFFEGDCNNVPDFLSKLDIFVLPSRFEGFGISIIEAIASCNFVAFSYIDGPRELNDEFKLGYTFELESIESICSTIKKIISENNYNKVYYDYIMAKEHFSINKVAIEMRKVYSNGR